MAMIAAGIMAAGVLGAAYMQSEASKGAAGQIAAGADAATQAQLAMYYQTREDYRPWREAGGQGINYLTDILKAGPGGTLPRTTNALTQFQSPYQQTSPTIKSVSWEPTQTGQPSAEMAGRPALSAADSALANFNLSNYNLVPYGRTNDGSEGWIDQNTQAFYGPGSEVARAKAYQTANPPQTTPTGYQTMPGGSPAAAGSTGVAEDLSWQTGWGDWADRYKASPYYNFLLGEGTKAIERGAAARGKLISGAENKALLEYGQGMASTDYDKWLSRWYQSLTPWQSLAGLGLTATGGVTQAGLQTASNVGTNALTASTAQAAGTLGQANAWAPVLQWGGKQAGNYLADYWNQQQQPQQQNYSSLGNPNYQYGYNYDY